MRIASRANNMPVDMSSKLKLSLYIHIDVRCGYYLVNNSRQIMQVYLAENDLLDKATAKVGQCK